MGDHAAEVAFEPQFADMPEGVMPGGFRSGEVFRAGGFREWRRRRFRRMKLKKVGEEWK